MKKSLIACLLLCAALLTLPLAACADTAPAVTITLDRESVAVGETVTATYEVSGEGTYIQVGRVWFAETDDGLSHNIGEDRTEQLKGSCSAAPKFGEELYLFLYVMDETGREYHFESERITVTGDKSKPPVVQISLNRNEVEIGEELTAEYEVSGEGNYVQIGRAWFAETDDGLSHNIGEDRTTQLKGMCSVVPEFGEELYLFLYVMDEAGREYQFESERIKVTGDEPKPPVVWISLDKAEVAIGEELSAEYVINGEGSYVQVGRAWFAATDDGLNHNIGEDKTTQLTGKCSVIPRFGEELYLFLYVMDETGREYHFESEKVGIAGFAENYDIYTVTEGANTQTSDGTSSLTFRADGAFEKYLGVQVDGKNVPKEHVMAWAGSTYVELSAEYLASLPAGEHELTIIFDDGVAATVFHTAETQIVDLPQTGDASRLAAWLALLAAACAALSVQHRRKHA